MGLHFCRLPFALLSFWSVLCFAAAPADAPPRLRLGEVQQVKPTGYRGRNWHWTPTKKHLVGSIVIRLQIDRPVQKLWLNATVSLCGKRHWRRAAGSRMTVCHSR